MRAYWAIKSTISADQAKGLPIYKQKCRETVKELLLSNQKWKNMYNQPKPGNEQVKMRQNTLGQFMEDPQAQKCAQPAKDR